MTISYFIPFVLFLLGTSIGSLITVITHRTKHKQKGILLGRSQCPNCKQKLQPQNLIPIISYIIQNGRCTYCAKKISYSYPLTEIITGLIFTLLYIKFQSSPIDLIFWLLICTFGIIITKYDIETHEVPPRFSIPMGLIGLIFSLFILNHNLIEIVKGGFIGFTYFYLLYKLSKGKWTGLGDADISLIIGIIFLSSELILILFLSYLLGSIIGIILLLTKQTNKETPLAFTPFILFSMFITLFFDLKLSHLIMLNYGF